MVTSSSESKGIVAIYKGAVKNVPILKYSWILIATICVLALTAYFKLNNADVFGYAVVLILVSFLGFLFSFLLKTKDKPIRLLLYLLVSSIVLSLAVIVISFASYVIIQQPKFFNRWFEPVKEEGSNKQEAIIDSSGMVNIKVAYNSIDTPKDTILPANLLYAPAPKEDLVTKIDPLTYNIKNRKFIKLIFYSKLRGIRDTIKTPLETGVEEFQNTLIEHYRLGDIVGNYDENKLNIDWTLIHEYEDLPFPGEITIEGLGWKNYDIISIKYRFTTSSRVLCPIMY